MTEAEIKALAEKVSKEATEKMEALKAEFKTLVDAATTDSYKKDELDKKFADFAEKANAIPEELKGITAKEFKEIADACRKQGEEIAAMKERGANAPDQKAMGLGDFVKKALIEKGMTVKNEDASKENGSEVLMIKGLKDAQKGKFLGSMDFKVAIDMTTPLAMVPGTNVNIGYLTTYGMKLVQLNISQDTRAMDVFPVIPITGKYFGVLVEYTETDGTATTAEDTAAGKSSFLFKTVEYKVFKINTYYHVSEEMLEDVDQLTAKINRVGRDRILSKIDTKIFATTGDNSTDIRGLYATAGTTHTAFVAGTYAASVKEANYISLIEKMMLQANATDDEVNAVVMNPNQISAIENLKDADGNSLLDRSVVFDQLGRLVSIKGLMVVKNKKQTTNTCAVFWSEAAEIGLRRDMNMIIGLDSDDLTTGMRTIVISARVAFGTGKPSAVIYSSDMDTDVATITLV